MKYPIILANPKERETDDAEEENDERHHNGQDRAPDTDGCETHTRDIRTLFNREWTKRNAELRGGFAKNHRERSVDDFFFTLSLHFFSSSVWNDSSGVICFIVTSTGIPGRS